MALALVTSFKNNITIDKHGRPVVALAFGLVAQRSPSGMIPTFSFMDLFQDVSHFLLVRTTSVGTFERPLISEKRAALDLILRASNLSFDKNPPRKYSMIDTRLLDVLDGDRSS